MNGTYIVLAVFLAFLCLMGGAILVAAAWFFLSLKKAIADLVETVKPLTADVNIRQALVAVIAMGQSLPEIHASVKAAAQAFGVFAEFAIGKPRGGTDAPGLAVPLPGIPLIPKPGEGTGEFIPPTPEPEMVDEQMKEYLRARGVELDPSRIDEPSPEKVVQG